MALNTLSNHLEENEKPIFSLEGFIHRQNEIQKQVEAGVIRGGQHMKFLAKILDFQKVLILFYGKYIDPIEYIHTLYYIENQSFETITSTIKGLYEHTQQEQTLFFTSSAIQKFAKDRLNWELKGFSESKNTFAYRNVDRIENTKKANSIELEKKQIIFLNWYIQNGYLNTENFDTEKFHNLNFEYEKFMYILRHLFSISKENFQKLKQTELGTPIIASAFNKIFTQNNIDFVVTEGTIRKTFLKYN